VPLLARSGASRAVAAEVQLAVPPPSSMMLAVPLQPPSSAHLPGAPPFRAPLLSVTVAAVAGLPSPQVMVVPAKSAAPAPRLASVRVATDAVLLRVPYVAANPLPLHAVSAASLPVAAPVAPAVVPPSFAICA